SVTARLASRRIFAVPPVERISAPRAASPRARSTTPVLSETLINARFSPAIRVPPMTIDLTSENAGKDNRCLRQVQGTNPLCDEISSPVRGLGFSLTSLQGPITIPP